MAASQTVRIHGPHIEISYSERLKPSDVKRLFHALFSHHGTRSVSIAPERRRIQVKLHKDGSPKQALQQLAVLVIKGPIGQESLPLIVPERATTLYRWGNTVTSLVLIDRAPGEVEVRIPRSQRRLIDQSSLRQFAGIVTLGERRFPNRLVIRHDPSIDPTPWIRRLERHLDPMAKQTVVVANPRVPFLMANTNLALCATSQFLYPAAIPWVCAVLLASRVPGFSKAARELGRGKIGTPFYSSVVVACSVATLAPFASALAEWLTLIWERRAGRVIAHETRGLLNTLPEVIALPNPDAPAPTVMLCAGDTVPFDGVVKEGDLLVRDGLFSDALSSPLQRKQPGDALVSGYLIIGGQGLLERDHAHEDRMASIVRILAELPASLTEDESLRGESRRLSDLTVYPNLALAGVAYSMGGLHMAGALMHQDWAASPMIAAPTEYFRDLRTGLSHGALVMTPGALTGLAKTSVLVVDADYPGLGDLRPRVSDLESPEKPISRANAWAHLLAEWIGDARSEAMRDLAEVSDSAPATATLITHERGMTRLSIDGYTVSLEDLPSTGEWPSLRIGIEGEADEIVHFGATNIPRLARTFERLRTIGVATAICGANAESIGARLGVDAVYTGLNEANFTRFREELSARGYQSALITHRPPPELVDQESAVVIGPLQAIRGVNASTIQLLGESLDSLFELMLASRTLKLRMGMASLRTLPTNLLCILGAFAGTFNGTMTTAIAHTGVLGVSMAQSRRIKKPREQGQIF